MAAGATMSDFKTSKVRNLNSDHSQSLLPFEVGQLQKNSKPIALLKVESKTKVLEKICGFVHSFSNDLQVKQHSKFQIYVTASSDHERFKEDLVELFALTLGLNSQFSSEDFVMSLEVVDNLRKNLTSEDAMAQDSNLLTWDSFVTLGPGCAIYLRHSGFDLPYIKGELIISRHELTNILVEARSERAIANTKLDSRRSA